jgi:hypothetical protein
MDVKTACRWLWRVLESREGFALAKTSGTRQKFEPSLFNGLPGVFPMFLSGPSMQAGFR